MKCQLLMTGHELMTGVTIDSNSAWIAEQLAHIGINTQKMVTVDDSPADLEREISHAIKDYQLLIINGGLGPTVDDLTAQVLANTLNEKLMVNPAAEKHVQQWCSKRGIKANSANLKQALLPSNSDIIANATGSAVGIMIEESNCLIICTPGVPSEMKQMMDEEIIPLLLKKLPNCQKQFTRRLQVLGMGESSIQQKINDEIPNWPAEIDLGFRAGFPTLEIKLTVRYKNQIPLRDEYETKLKELLGAVIFGKENDSLAQVLVRALQGKQEKITTAESCTGGLIASQLTSIAGASQVFEAGFVSYSNTVKQEILAVQEKTIREHGAVSEAVVLEMAQGALQKSHAHYVIAVSGIAGPDGDTTEKPVGTVWLAWGTNENLKTACLFYPAQRKQFQILITAYALDLVRRDILGITEKPRYI